MSRFLEGAAKGRALGARKLSGLPSLNPAYFPRSAPPWRRWVGRLAGGVMLLLGAAASTVGLAAGAAPAPRLWMARHGAADGEQLYLFLERSADTNWQHAIEVSTNLATWRTRSDCHCLIPLPDPPPPENGTNRVVAYQVTDSAASDAQRFFRAKLIPRNPYVYRLHGLNFSPYLDPDENPTPPETGRITLEELQTRLRAVAPLTRWIRTFGCTGDLAPAGRLAHALNLSTAIGAWLGRDEAENRKQIEALVEQALQGSVDLAVVGSEVLLRGDLTEQRLLEYLAEVRARLDARGLAIPVTYADVYGVYLSHPALLAAVDVAFVNYYPYWEGRHVDCAVAYLHRWHQMVREAAPGLEVIVAETGWPTCGERKGEAVPSPENAAEYFLTFVSWARANQVQYFYFAAFDEPWKAAFEGPQGACWGLMDSSLQLKPGLERVFWGETTEDRWSTCASYGPIIDFFAQPDVLTSNLRHHLVAGMTGTNNRVELNGVPLGDGERDDAGHFATVVPLRTGGNRLELTIRSSDPGLVVREATKEVYYVPTHSTAGTRLAYVSVVPGEGQITAVDGTVVIDLDGHAVLGVIPEARVRGIAPDGGEIYLHDNTVIETATHTVVRTLPFTSDLPLNGFLVSPDGRWLYSHDQIVNVANNELLASRLPVDITTGSSWGGAPTPGGPAISPDGRFIYCRNAVVAVDTMDLTSVDTGLSGKFMSDLAVHAASNLLLISEYSYAQGRLKIADRTTFESRATIKGLGDFTGEIAVLGDYLIVGSSGNPASSSDGRINVIDLPSNTIVSTRIVPLADNLTVTDRGEILVSTGLADPVQGSRLGLDVFVLSPDGELLRKQTFFLGVNRFVASASRPRYDQVRRIVYKPARVTAGISRTR